MSQQPIDRDLQNIYELIEDERHDEAREQIQDYLKDHPESADAWWLYAHAVDDPEEARHALENVLEINPTYPGARPLMQQVNSVATGVPVRDLPRLDATSPEETENFTPDFLESFDDPDEAEPVSAGRGDDFDAFDDFDDSDFDDTDMATETSGSRRRLLIPLLLLLAIVVIAAVALIILNPFQQSDQQVAQNTPTVSPTETTAFEIPPALADEDAAALYSAIEAEDLEVVADSATIEPTTLGDTLTVSICSPTRGQGLRDTVVSGLYTIAAQAESVADSVNAIAGRFVDCTGDNNVIRFIGFNIEDATAFARGEIDETTLISRQQTLQ